MILRRFKPIVEMENRFQNKINSIDKDNLFGQYFSNECIIKINILNVEWKTQEIYGINNKNLFY